MDHVLSAFDKTLSNVKADKLLQATLSSLSSRETKSNIEEMIKLYREELELFRKALKLKSRVLELLIELERYAMFRDNVLKTYMEKLGLNPSDKPRLRICRNYGNESVCISTLRTTYWIGDNAVYNEFKRYLQIKKTTIETLKQYRELLSQLLGSDYAWVRKLARYLLREARGYKRMLRGLSSSS